MMTEEEAEEKWCPMVRMNGSNVIISMNSGERVNQSSTSCMGSDCMMWQWVSDAGVGLPPTKGYCGLIKS